MRGRHLRRSWLYDPTIHAPPRYRRACSYDAFVPDPLGDLEILLDGEIAGLVSEAETGIAELNAAPPVALEPLARLLLRTESIASSKVEGMQVDPRTLARAEVANDTGKRIGPEAAEIIANVDAMQFAIETATAHHVVEPGHIGEIHRVLLDRSSTPERAGRFREVQNWIGGNDYNPCGAEFVPPPETEVAELIEDLCRFCSQDILPPIVQAALAHAQFETIHPFEDGNGRTGRALVQVLLRRRGLAPAFVPPISVLLAGDKGRYVNGLTSFRENDISGWLEVFASAAARSADLARRYLTAVERLQERWKTRVREVLDLRSDAAAWGMIEVLPGHPVVTVAVAAAALDSVGRRRSRAAVQVAVEQLVEAGVLIPVGESRRNRAWEAQGLLDLISSAEAGRI